MKRIITPNKFWFVTERGNGIAHSVSHNVQTKGNILTTHHICHLVDGSPHSMPNAYLISMAPRMLELLERIRAQKIFHGVLVDNEINELIYQARLGETDL